MSHQPLQMYSQEAPSSSSALRHAPLPAVASAVSLAMPIPLAEPANNAEQQMQEQQNGAEQQG